MVERDWARFEIKEGLEIDHTAAAPGMVGSGRCDEQPGDVENACPLHRHKLARAAWYGSLTRLLGGKWQDYVCGKRKWKVFFTKQTIIRGIG